MLRVAVCDVGETGGVERIIGRAELGLPRLLEERCFSEPLSPAVHDAHARSPRAELSASSAEHRRARLWRSLVR